jgi:hypothetical protein
MMDSRLDSVERLRSGDRVADVTTRRELREAADEIDRLRRMIRHCDHCGGSWVDDGINSGCHCKEIERLRGHVKQLRRDRDHLWHQLAEVSAAQCDNFQRHICGLPPNSPSGAGDNHGD